MQEQFSELSRRYREEMLRMYGKKSPSAQETPPTQEQSPQDESPQAALPIEPAENPDFTGQDGDYRDMLTIDFPEDFEEPMRPDTFHSEPPPMMQGNDDEMEHFTETGNLRVAALSGNSAFPVEGAAVTVAVRRKGGEQLAYLLTTGESGETPTVSLPAPPASLSQQPGNPQPFTVVDIRVFANGYFRAEMLNVPIFAGVTSLQTFQLIPLPALMHEDRETLSGSTESPDL